MIVSYTVLFFTSTIISGSSKLFFSPLLHPSSYLNYLYFIITRLTSLFLLCVFIFQLTSPVISSIQTFFPPLMQLLLPPSPPPLPLLFHPLVTQLPFVFFSLSPQAPRPPPNKPTTQVLSLHTHTCIHTQRPAHTHNASTRAHTHTTKTDSYRTHTRAGCEPNT